MKLMYNMVEKIFDMYLFLFTCWHSYWRGENSSQSWKLETDITEYLQNLGYITIFVIANIY